MHRIYLFAPGDSARKVGKAFESEADAIILDLEDGVALSQKETARKVLLGTVQNLRKEHLLQKPFYVRCNSAKSTFIMDDLTVIKELQPLGIMLPKFESADEINSITDVLGELEILPLIESVAGICCLRKSTFLPPQIKRLAFGAVDYALDLGADWSASGKERQFAMSEIVFQSRALNLESPVDAVFPVLDNPATFEKDIQTGKQLGFFGKMIIHPKQIESVRSAYQVSDAEYSWSLRVIDKYESNIDTGALELDGKLIDLPIYLKAQKVASSRPPQSSSKSTFQGK